MLDKKKIIFLIPPELNEIEISKIFLSKRAKNTPLLAAIGSFILKFSRFD